MAGERKLQMRVAKRFLAVVAHWFSIVLYRWRNTPCPDLRQAESMNCRSRRGLSAPLIVILTKRMLRQRQKLWSSLEGMIAAQTQLGMIGTVQSSRRNDVVIARLAVRGSLCRRLVQAPLERTLLI
jgi:hypothetical protein